MDRIRQIYLIPYFFMFLGHSTTSLVLCHLLTSDGSLTLLLMLSSRTLLTLPSSAFVELIGL